MSTTPTRSRPVVRVSSPASRSPLEPGEKTSGFEFRKHSLAATCPKEYIPGVEKGIGRRHGHPACWQASHVVDVKVTLTDGAYHDVDSSAVAFEIAGRACNSRRAAKGLAPRLLEPIMKVEVVTRGVSRQRDRRPEFEPPRADARARSARGNATGGQCHGAAGQHVQICR